MLLSPLSSLANTSLQRFVHRQIVNCQYTTKSSSKIRLSIRNLSSSASDDDNGIINGSTNGSSSDILKSAAATTQWKRKHYQTIEDKFQSNKDTTNTTNTSTNCNESDTNQSTKSDEPLSIESYEDVQPMWKEMESRVTKRRSLTLDERKGVSGRRNVRKSDEDVWLANGVYDDESSSEDNDKDDDNKKD